MNRVLLRTTLVVVVLAGSAALAPRAEAQAEGGTACSRQQLTTTVSANNIEPAPDVTGGRVVFTSNVDFGGGNPDGNEEVWLRDRSAGTTTQVTNTTGGDTNSADHPDISDDGTRIVFSTNRNIGGVNPEQDNEVYLFRTDTSTFTPLTSGGGSTTPSISDDGTQVVYASDGDPTGDNPDGNIELFRRTVGGPTIQLTETTGAFGNRNPIPDGDGSRVVFSSADDIGGNNPDGSFEVFLWDATGGVTTQITDSPSEDSDFPTISESGTVLVFESRADLTGDNPDENSEIFRHLMATGTTTQITDSVVGESFSASLSDNGARTAFESEADLDGLNSEGNSEIWLFDTGTGIAPVTSSTSGDNFNATMFGNGAGVVFESETVTAANPEGNPEIVLAVCGPPQRCDGQDVTVHLAFGQAPTNGADVILGTAGADTVLARGGNDRFCGLGGEDTFAGGGGNDRAFGGQGNDTLLGQGGNDLLDGGAGSDTLVGQAARDTCHGRAGNDIAPTCEVRTGIP